MMAIVKECCMKGINASKSSENEVTKEFCAASYEEDMKDHKQPKLCLKKYMFCCGAKGNKMSKASRKAFKKRGQIGKRRPDNLRYVNARFVLH